MESELIRELINLNKHLSAQLREQSHFIFGLLKVLPPENLNKLQKLLDAQSEAYKKNDAINESCLAALALVKKLKDNGSEGKNIFEVIEGGKKDYKHWTVDSK